MGKNKWVIQYKDLMITEQGKSLVIWEKGNKERKSVDYSQLLSSQPFDSSLAEVEFYKEKVADFLINNYDQLLSDYEKSVHYQH